MMRQKYDSADSIIRLQAISREEYFRACRQAEERRKRRRAVQDLAIGLIASAGFVALYAVAVWLWGAQ